MEIKRATRTGVKPLIVIYSESGCGKTYSSLLLARGLAGKNGRVGIIDTENGRGELYADVPIFGGYDVIRITDPFTPARYIEALALAQSNFDAVVLDSGSHEWEGIGGVLDMAADNEHKSGRPGLHNWRQPKFEHAKFVQALMRSPVPVIVCLRAKFKTKQKKENNKTVIIKDDFTSPIQADDFIFEATVHGEIMPDHSLRLTKWSHPALKECFPDGKPIEVRHGEMVAKWCLGGATASPIAQPVAKAATTTAQPVGAPADELKALATELWTLLKPVRGLAADWTVANSWLNMEGILTEGEVVPKGVSPERMKEIITKAKEKL